jgi:hypothetical protein
MFPMSQFREDGVIDTEPMVTCPDPSDQGVCPIRTGDILFDVAVDRTDGTLYAVWQDARFGGQRFDSIAFSRSTDNGLTWSAPIKVNRTPTSEPVDDQQAFTPPVHVTDDGTVVVTHLRLPQQHAHRRHPRLRRQRRARLLLGVARRRPSSAFFSRLTP